jgi:hypothetical protein
MYTGYVNFKFKLFNFNEQIKVRWNDQKGTIVKVRIYTVEKKQKNNPNLLALFAFYRYFIIIGSVWGYLHIYHIFADHQNIF